MHSIKFTRFHQPDARKTEELFECSEELAQLAEKIIADGFRFTIELLSTGDVSICIEDTKSDLGDFDCALAENNEQTPAAIERIISRYNSADAAIWRAQFADNPN